MSIDSNAAAYVANNLSLQLKNVIKVLDLSINQDCTIPFIARYRKEATGGLDEVQITAIRDGHEAYVETEKRRKFIIETIEQQGKLTPQLKAKILKAESLNILEDLYAPFKSKRKTKGQLAIEAGLSQLAELIKTSKDGIEKISKEQVKAYINKELKFGTTEDVLDGVKSIIAEEIVHDADLKDQLRKDYWSLATLKSSMKKDADKIKDSQKFKDYFDFEQKVKDLKAAKASHRFLAMRRGMSLKILKVAVDYDENLALSTIQKNTYKDLSNLGCKDFLKDCIKRAYTTSIHPSLDLEIKSQLKLLSDESAIDVFNINLKNLLLQPYLGQKSVLGIDPGVRTGCKIAVIDKNGNFLVDTVIYPHEPKKDIAGSKNVIETCINQLKIKHIAIGNGTYGRETLQFLKDHIPAIKAGEVKAMLVNEDGASIYSASEIARKEFPDKDITVRGAISIARRFQDPLAELVKIDPKSIGVGQYQHDVNQAKLKKSLTGVVENCVNYVGVDLNTASAPLLAYVSGVGPNLASNIIKFREKNSGFKSRRELLDISRFSPKIYEQAAGFLRIHDGEEPFDGTFIHPERYHLLKLWCKKRKISIKSLIGNELAVNELKNDEELQNEIGVFTLADIVKSLLAPSQDPRTEFISFAFRNDATDISSLKVNEYYPGIVTNITQFGAFVDIGIKENGLIHVSQIADKFVENALEVLKVGQELKVRVMEIDHERKRISLSLKSENDNRPVTTKASSKHPQQKRNQKPRQKYQKPQRNDHNKELKFSPFAQLKKK